MEGWIMKTLLLGFVAIIFALASVPESAAQALAKTQSTFSVPFLTVNGEGQVPAAPDQAVLRLGAAAQAQEAAAAQEMVNEIMQRALQAIKAVGIPPERITTVGLSLWPVYTQHRPKSGEEPGVPKIAAYRASNTIRVQVDDLSAVGRVIDAGVAAGSHDRIAYASLTNGIVYCARRSQAFRSKE
jgi:uncharacterized protein YggE